MSVFLFWAFDFTRIWIYAWLEKVLLLAIATDVGFTDLLGGRVWDVRADLGSLVPLKFLFGFLLIAVFHLLLADRSRVTSVIPKHWPHQVYLAVILKGQLTQKCPPFAIKKPLLFGLLDSRGESRIRSSTSERVALTPPQNNPVDLKPRGTTKKSKKNIRVINSRLRV